MTNLYDLPKDILIKLIGTIQEDSNKQILEIKQKLEDTDELLDAYKNLTDGEYHICNHQGCKAKVIYDNVYDDTRKIYINCKQLSECEFIYAESGYRRCGRWYCEEHISTYTKKMVFIYGSKKWTVCNECELQALKVGFTYSKI